MNSNLPLFNNLDTTVIHNTDKGQLLDIVIGSERFSPESTGLWNLNEIHKRLNLPESKEPSQWRTKVSTHYDRSANLQTVNGDGGGTFATEEAAIAYAMWVSIEFYSMVVRAFLTMRTQAVIEAKEKARYKQAFMSKLIAQGVSWREACKNAGITNPELAKKYLVKVVAIKDNPWYGCRDGELRFIISKSSTDRMLFKTVKGRYNNEGFRVLLAGYNRMKERASEINEYTRQLQAKQRNANSRK